MTTDVWGSRRERSGHERVIGVATRVKGRPAVPTLARPPPLALIDNSKGFAA